MKYTQTAGGSYPGKEITHTGRCDLCGISTPIIYDARIQIGTRSAWAWACPDCFTSGAGQLGVGAGQEYKLATTGEVKAP
jgi:hypothetical protein